MNILVCNDDGINSEGINALAIMLNKKGHKVTVVAPSENCSGYAHSVTFYKNITVKNCPLNDKIDGYSLTGTPADCVKYGLDQLNKEFDLVVGGINHGSNLGTEVQYSGTVAVGMEANTFSKKAIAFSCPHYKEADFNVVAEICAEIVEKYFNKLNGTFTLNVNIPAVKDKKDIKGYKITPLGVRMYTDVYEYSQKDVFMLTGSPVDWDNPEDCDVNWLEKGYVSLTPVLYDKTSYSAIRELKDN